METSPFAIGVAVGAILSFLASFLYSKVQDSDIAEFNLSGNFKTPCKLILVVRNDLGMGKGKIAAQCSHATLGIYKKLVSKHHPLLGAWEAQGQAKITVQVKDEKEMLALKEKALTRGLPSYIVEDAGRTQIAAGSKTVLAIFGGVKQLDDVTGHLKLL
mmetsp:Transcript_6860/g.10762  ORF Transcript_6860/g.10762 Transcript_6860/m.10762 type:complete len:159 (-) Transcript_6860:358-834(-)